MKGIFRTVYSRYRYSLILLRQLVITDFKLRYQGSALGYVWSLLRPLFLFVILYVVFVKFLRIGGSIPHYPVYLLSGIVFWNFFSEVTSGSVEAIVGRGDLIRKINFPKYVIILSTCVSALINLVLNMVILVIFMIVNHVDFRPEIIWVIPLTLELLLFSLGVGFILSALYVRLRDVNHIWEVSLQALFYATPVIYPLGLVSARWPWAAKVMLLNPVAQVIQDVRYSAVTTDTQTAISIGGHWLLLASLTVVLFILAASSAYFKSRSPYFAEEV